MFFFLTSLSNQKIHAEENKVIESTMEETIEKEEIYVTIENNKSYDNIISYLENNTWFKKVTINADELDTENKIKLFKLLSDLDNIDSIVCDSKPFRFMKKNGKNIITSNFKSDFNWKKIPQNIQIYLGKNAFNGAIFLTKEDLKYLQENNRLCYEEEETINKLYWINDELDKIVLNLKINKDDTDQQKLDKILLYITKNYSYDEEIPETLEFDKVYKEGFLYGVFFNNNKIICGNYAALTSALLKRVGVESYLLINEKHAWNLVNLNGKYYYVDATFLDDPENMFANEFLLGVDEEEALKKYEWYLFDDSKEDLDENHDIEKLPENINLTSIKKLKLESYKKKLKYLILLKLFKDDQFHLSDQEEIYKIILKSNRQKNVKKIK